ncbi:MAG: NAD(P)-dependent glycerol-3-phosphate dehydrogenase [Betaproteobacteria bacterium]|nr:MAG: NAD(P)-dependent glycerol-3-phosphate dehydrogenase [Betaproteobacteria bacterium]
MKLAVIGAGAWGTALAVTLSAKYSVSLWSRSARHVSDLRRDDENKRYLPGIRFGGAVEVVDQIETAMQSAGLVLFAVPTAGLREVLRSARDHMAGAGGIWVCKGFEPGSGKLPHEVAAEEFSPATLRGVLSGPSFAVDVARGLPTAVTLAASEEEFAITMARRLHTGRFRVYSSTDLIGVEVGGAVKNVIAIAAGICDGLQLGDSARAALVTRGLAEITRLGVRLGGRMETFMGLSGLGDLTLTCAGDLSRNRRVGLALATGKRLTEILSELGHVAEGVHTANEVLRLANELGVEMPITQVVVSVLAGSVSPAEAVEALLHRDPKPESGAQV